MRVDNARRLTGPGFFAPRSGAAVELWVEAAEQRDAVMQRWTPLLDKLLDLLGLLRSERFHHVHMAGFTTAVTAPIDRCVALADALEWAGLHLAGQTSVTLSEAVHAFHDAIPGEADPRLTGFERAARTHGVPFLWDDDHVSIGLGAHSKTWPARELPDFTSESFDWAPYLPRIPVGLVTGTNGKTTTTRMTAAILRQAGHRVGASSTDAITLDGLVIEEGDWTGPGAARKVLRHPEVTAAVLETARGGILRRGLAFDDADAAIVTNVGADHFGEYGITTVEEMANVKAVVWQGVREGGKRIANVGCPVTAAHVHANLPEVIGHEDWVLIARDPGSPTLHLHLEAGGEGWTVVGQALTHVRGPLADHRNHVRVATINEIPATFGGTAIHNIDNALAAAALGHALGVAHPVIGLALAGFGASPDDNPGRIERYDLDGVTLLLDFAHNAHGLLALAPTVAHLRKPGSRLFIGIGQAGDRSIADLDSLAAATLALDPHDIIVRPMPGYERGRTLDEMVQMITSAFERVGFAKDHLSTATDEVDVLEQAVSRASPGDLIVLLVHYQRVEVRAWLAERNQAQSSPGNVAAP